jgi:hypothetical protein
LTISSACENSPIDNTDRNCQQYAGGKILGIISAVFAGVAVIAVLLLARVLPEFIINLIWYSCVLLSAVTGAVSTGLFVDVVRLAVAHYGASYGYSFIVFVIGWGLVSEILPSFSCY